MGLPRATARPRRSRAQAPRPAVRGPPSTTRQQRAYARAVKPSAPPSRQWCPCQVDDALTRGGKTAFRGAKAGRYARGALGHRREPGNGAPASERVEFRPRTPGAHANSARPQREETFMRPWILNGAWLGLSLVASSALADSAALLASAPAEQVGMSKVKLERIGTAFKQEIDQGKLPGVVIMVARKGKLVYSNAMGFQDKGSGVPMKSDSLFRIYSMTKPMVAAGAMMLVEEGKIQLTDPVSKFLPAFKGQQVSVATCRRRVCKAHLRHRPRRPRDHDSGSVPPYRRARLWRDHGKCAGEGGLHQGGALQ